MILLLLLLTPGDGHKKLMEVLKTVTKIYIKKKKKILTPSSPSLKEKKMKKKKLG